MADVQTTQALRFRIVEGWEQLPAGFTHLDCVGVGVDSEDRVYLLTRAEPRVIVYDRDGRFVRSWGEELFTPRAHGLTVAPDGSVYVVDEGVHAIYRFSSTGERLGVIGALGVASDTGYAGTLASIRGGPPFNRPTNLAIAPNGELYVTDGYGNCKVHRFSRTGQLVQSWGEPGGGPGQFNLPHGVAVAADGRVLVADRENGRIQIFSPEGRFIDQWTHVQRPTQVRLDAAGRVYVSELWWRVGDAHPTGEVVGVERPARVSVLDSDGKLLARFGAGARVDGAPGTFVAPHDLCVDSRGDVYVAEVTDTFGIRPGLVPVGTHTLQKFAREA